MRVRFRVKCLFEFLLHPGRPAFNRPRRLALSELEPLPLSRVTRPTSFLRLCQ